MAACEFFIDMSRIVKYLNNICTLLPSTPILRNNLARPVTTSIGRSVTPRYPSSNLNTTFQRSLFSTSRMTFHKPSTDPPKHEMAFFPNMTTSLPSESAEFRRVLWTGLYSQLVLMTVPVGGDIGDEVCSVHVLRSSSVPLLTFTRFTPSTRSLPSPPVRAKPLLQARTKT